jgi:hypothetical protein
VWAEPLPAEVETVRETIYLALNTGQEVTDHTLHYDGPVQAMHAWLAREALLFVQQKL